jgi:hypothetical protein
LLEASVAAHDRAVSLEPKIRTSVVHTWFFQGDHARVATIKPADFPYIVPLSMAALGRGTEAIAALRELEQKIPTRVRDMITSARLLLEGQTADSVAAITRFVADFKDPEALFYAARHLAHLNEPNQAIELLERAVAGGFFCFPAMARDPWLDPLRKTPAFTKILGRAEAEHRQAANVFTERGGEKVLGVSVGRP